MKNVSHASYPIHCYDLTRTKSSNTRISVPEGTHVSLKA